ncbi:MAG: hypothetical protein N4A50_07955 [Vallitalea sp.]|nr:hypothetical protein [Vallitalea sp.]
MKKVIISLSLIIIIITTYIIINSYNNNIPVFDESNILIKSTREKNLDDKVIFKSNISNKSTSPILGVRIFIGVSIVDDNSKIRSNCVFESQLQQFTLASGEETNVLTYVDKSIINVSEDSSNFFVIITGYSGKMNEKTYFKIVKDI